MQQGVIFLSALIVLAVVVIGFGVWGLFVERRSSDSDGMGQIFGASATFAGVVMGLVTSLALADFKDAEAMVQREANAVLNLSFLLDGLPDGQGVVGIQKLESYVGVVLEQEWGREDTVQSNYHPGQEAFHALANSALSTESPGAVSGRMVSALEDLLDARRQRLSTVRSGLPVGMWLALGIVYSAVLLHPLVSNRKSGGAYRITLGLFALSMGCVLVALYGLSHPFSPPIAVGAEALKETLELFPAKT